LWFSVGGSVLACGFIPAFRRKTSEELIPGLFRVEIKLDVFKDILPYLRYVIIGRAEATTVRLFASNVSKTFTGEISMIRVQV
jgi:hypothetical protein